MNTSSIFSFLLLLCFPVLLSAQNGDFETCYMNLCKDGGLTTLQVSGTDKIEVRSTTDGSTYDIISFTATFVLAGSKVECTSRGNVLSTRCISLRDKLTVDDEMVFKDVVFKDIKGGGKIRTAPELRITVVKPVDETGK